MKIKLKEQRLLDPAPRPERTSPEAPRESLYLGHVHIRARHRRALDVHARLGEPRDEAAHVTEAAPAARREELVVL